MGDLAHDWDIGSLLQLSPFIYKLSSLILRPYLCRNTLNACTQSFR